VFRGQYLPLSLSKRGVPYIKKIKIKKKNEKGKCKIKKEPHKKIKSAVVRFYQACELIRFYQGWKLVWSCLSVRAARTCPILPRLWTCPFLPGLKTGSILLVRFARFYQGCELVHFYQGWKLVRSCLSILPDFTKVDNLSVFTRPANLSGFPTGWELDQFIVLFIILIMINRLVARPARPASRTTGNP
jgi:hypothetical protein